MVYCVGLTGNLASGKTTVANLFASKGIKIINADAVAKALTTKDQAAFTKIVAHYGPDILREDGELNRSALRDIIFSNTEERKWLESLLHPLIRQRIKEEVDLCTTPYCIVEIPLLIDKKIYPYLNHILLINAPLEMQVSRVMQRDHCSKEDALTILSAQSDVNLHLKNADEVLNNNLGINELKEAVDKLHQRYLQEAGYQ